MSKETFQEGLIPDSPRDSVSAPWKLRLRNLFRSPNKNPTYHITKGGVTVNWHDFSNTEKLPFDKETYKDTQIFIGEDYANPWKVDIESIEEHYDEFSSKEPLTNLISNNHVIPSQKYKTYMNQTVLQDSFYPGGYQWERMKYVLYGILGASVINLMVSLQ